MALTTIHPDLMLSYKSHLKRKTSPMEKYHLLTWPAVKGQLIMPISFKNRRE
jgi:hypothetical protein